MRCAVQAIVVPFVGVVGNMSNRIYLITLGALIWAGMSTAFGLSTTYSEASLPAILMFFLIDTSMGTSPTP